jgi:6-hydroxy-3-succinoylpyridine 3-monooxygenase
MQRGIENEGALRTRVYIDGYNLYYGCLKSTPYKWLDVGALVERILASIPYQRDGVAIRYSRRSPAVKFFTAPILSAFARSDDSVSCQVNYHAALQTYLGNQMEIVAGYHDAKPARAYRWIEGRAARECEMIEVWKLEESSPTSLSRYTPSVMQ